MIFFGMDSRGQQSRTLAFVTVSWFIVTVKFLVAGIALGPLGTAPPMTAGEYGLAAGAILAIWLGREWTEKK